MFKADEYRKVELINAREGIYVSAEEAIREGDRLILKGRDLELIPHQTRVDIVAYFDDGLLFMFGIVTLSLPIQINVDIVEAASEKEERRNHLKVRTAFEAKVNRIYSLGGSGRYMNTDIDIQVRDLSLGGIGFYSNHPFFPRQKLTVSLQSLFDDFEVEYRILRKERVIENIDPESRKKPIGYHYHYGGKMYRLTSAQERMICEYVFRVQLEEYHRQLEFEEEWGDA